MRYKTQLKLYTLSGHNDRKHWDLQRAVYPIPAHGFAKPINLIKARADNLEYARVFDGGERKESTSVLDCAVAFRIASININGVGVMRSSTRPFSWAMFRARNVQWSMQMCASRHTTCRPVTRNRERHEVIRANMTPSFVGTAGSALTWVLDGWSFEDSALMNLVIYLYLFP